MRLQEKVIGNKLRQENVRAYLFDSFEKVITNWLLFWHKFPKSMLGEEAERKATIICLCVWINSPPKDSVLLDHQTLCSTPALAECLSPSTWWMTGFCVLTLDKQVCKVLIAMSGSNFITRWWGCSHIFPKALWLQIVFGGLLVCVFGWLLGFGFLSNAGGNLWAGFLWLCRSLFVVILGMSGLSAQQGSQSQCTCTGKSVAPLKIMLAARRLVLGLERWRND